MFPSLYPGSAYVDWIGYDPYNFASCHNIAWKSFTQTIDPMYQWLETNGYGNKPFMLPEYGTVPDSTNPSAAATWYSQIPAALTTHPNLKAMLSWDDSTGSCDTQLTSSPGTLSSFSAVGASSQVIGTAPPATPAAPTATATSTTAASVSWTAVPGATSYQVLRSTGTGNNYSADGSPVTGTSMQDTGLTPGGTYAYEVVATNAGGVNSAPSAATSVTLLPSAPSNLTATPTSATEIDLNWSAALGATSYDVREGPAGSGNFPSDLGSVNGTSFSVTGLAPGTGFAFEVLPVSSGGNGSGSNVATATTLPAQVNGIVATAASTTEIDLSWPAVTGATSYDIERSPAGAGSWSVLSYANSATSVADAGLSPATSYDYRVAAVGASGQGQYSNTTTGTTNPLPPPPAPTGSGGGTGSGSGSTATASVVQGTSLWNGFESGSNGAALTAASSAGGSANALDGVSCSSGSATFSSASAAHGNLSASLAPTKSLCYVQWAPKSIGSTSNAYGRDYIRLTADPSGKLVVLKALDSTWKGDVQVELSKTGQLSFRDASLKTQATFSNPIPLNTWVRLEWHLVAGTNGSFELRMYQGDSTTPIESEMATGINAGTAVSAVQVGELSALPTNIGTTIGIDDMAYSTSGWIGAAG
jgi:fibronectin type 3 domain-containing protein